MTTVFPYQPYYDDYDAAKNYQRVLFRPGYPVQARELTQLQTAIQSQIERFGNHVFTEGATVLNSERFFDRNVFTVTTSGTVLTSIVGKVVTGSTSETTALVKAYEPGKLLVSMLSGKQFTPGETLTYVNDNNITINVTTTNTPITEAMLFSVNAGVLYLRGNFVYVEKQSIILDATSNLSSHSVGFSVVEEVITSDDDESLLDNAQGSPNFAAPGADRYAITLTLTRQALNNTVQNYIEIARVVAGELVYVQDRTLYSELEKEFARRTYDESGNYTVKAFELSFDEHRSNVLLKPTIVGGAVVGMVIVDAGEEFEEVPSISIVGDGTGATATAVLTNKILTDVNIVTSGTGYTSNETYAVVSGDPSKFSAKLEAGKAYVRGFEFETAAPTYVTMSKARTTNIADNTDIPSYYGNYVYTTSMYGLFNTDAFVDVELHNVVRTSVSGATTKIGSAKVRFIDYVSGTIGSTAVYKMYLFGITVDTGNRFEDLESIVIRSGATVNSGANVDLLSKVDGIVTNDVFLSGTDRTSLVFPLNHAYVRTLRDASNLPQNDYTFKRVFPTVNFTAGVGSISTGNGSERFVGGAGVYTVDNIRENYHFVVTNVGTSSYTLGQVITPNSATGGVIASGAAQAVTFTFTGAGGFTAAIIASINADAQTEKTKSLQNYVGVVIASPSTAQGGRNSVNYSDIYKFAKVYNAGTTNPTSSMVVNPTTGVVTGVTVTDVTANYNFDNGQRDDLYDHGAVILNGTAPGATDYLIVTFNYFTHTNNGFASVDSYSIPYEDIPSFTSPLTGATISLADAVDFRPKRANGGTNLTNGQLPNPDLQFQTDYSYYVGRIDRILATSSKSFSVKQGIPATVPVAPTEEENGMTLYVVEIPPYTESLSDISVKYVDNKRFTMRDIGGLEKRIESLEYYTQLSLLEKQTKDESFPDASGLEKFKNGFFADPFTAIDSLDNASDPGAWAKQIWGWWNNRQGSSYSLTQGVTRSTVAPSESLNVDFKAAIDPVYAEMRAQATTSFGEFTFQTGTGARKTGSLITLDYTEVEFASNLLASKSVNINPFDVIAFNGAIDLEPSIDRWVETNTLPAVNKVVDVQLQDAATVTNRVVTGRYSKQLLFKTTGTSSTIVTNVIGEQTSSLGSAVVDIQYIPYARPRTIIGVGAKFKPKARLYPFFDDIPFSQYVTPLTVIETSNNVGLFVADEIVQIHTGSTSGPVVASANVAVYSPAKTTDPTKRLLTIYNIVGTLPTTFTNVFVTGAAANAAVTDIVTYVTGAAIVPDEYGLVGFRVDVPADTVRTGSRTFRLIDNIDNVPSGSQSVGNAVYQSEGLIQDVQETVLTTRTVQNQKVVTNTGYYYDPLAQTFNVDPRFYDAGVHLSSVDVYFKTKSDTIPVSLEVTKTVNGYPESVITSIPFAVCNKNAEEVNISEDGSVATRFTLPSPVHLLPGEYALVLKANTQDYEVFVSEMGRTDIITNQIIAKQPALGVLFKSQNASTWTAFQEEDLKFRINMADFSTSGSAEFAVTDIDDFRYSTLNLLTSNALPAGTNISFSFKSLNPGSPADLMDTQWIPITTNVDLSLGQVKKVNGVSSFLVKADLSTANSNVSPFIDLEGLGVILVNNVINFTDVSGSDLEAVATGGDALAKYISKPIRLADGFESTNFTVTLDAYIPPGTEVRVYGKFSPTTSTTPFQNNVWTRLALKPGTVITASANVSDFKELKFYPTTAFGNYGIPVDSPLASFNIYAIKVVLASANEAYSPIIRDLRAIAYLS